MFDPTQRRLHRNPQRRDPRKTLSLEPLEDRRLLHATPMEAALVSFHGEDLVGKDGPLVKIGLDLAYFHQELLFHAALQPGTPYVSSNDLPVRITGDLIEIDVAATGNVDTLVTQLTSLGASNIAVAGALVNGMFPIGNLAQLAALDSMRLARPTYTPITAAGLTTSQADSALGADVARSLFGVTGAGVSVGVLSDSFNALTYPGGVDALTRDIETDDLPVDTTILQDYLQPGASDEGRAMAQHIHDLAPEASILFATAFIGGEAGFAQNILALAAAGADIITDDIRYFAEPFFQDGVVARAAQQVVAQGIPFFSAAFNEGVRSYESAFVDSGVTLESGARLHDFDPGAGVSTLQEINVPLGGGVRFSFQWDQPFASLGGAGSQSDLDISLLGADGTTVISTASTNNIDGDALELLLVNNTGFDLDIDGQQDTKFFVRIELVSGPEPGILKYVDYGRSSTIITFATDSSTSVGHANTANVLGVAASAFFQTPEFGESPPVLNDYSSKGGTSILFDASGQRLVTPFNPNAPQVTGVDGGNTTFFGTDTPEDADNFPNFFGTSAAAPHLAAVAALMMELTGGPGNVTPQDIYDAMMETAIDIANRTDGQTLIPIPNGQGFDEFSGYGLVDAVAALQAINSGLSLGDDVTLFEGDSGFTDFVFAVIYTGTPVEPVSVAYATVDGAAVAGADYLAVSGTLTFTVGGPTVQFITVNVIGDQQVESNESFLVRLSEPVNGIIVRDEVVGTILNDDVDLSVSDVIVAEGNSGTRNAVFTVTAFGEANRPISFSYSTLNGTAQSGSDYLPLAGVITLPSGNTSVQITVPVLGDRIDEDNETFFLALTGAQGARIADAFGQATIIDEDPLPSLYVSDAQVTTTEAGTYQVTFSVALDVASGRQVNVNYSTADFSAIAGVDYIAKSGVLSFAPGVINQLVTVDVMTSGVPGANKRFSLNMTGVSNAEMGDSRGDCYIVYADEPQNEFIIDNGAAGYSRSFTGWTTLTNTLAYHQDFDYASAGNGSAFANWNFTAIPNGSYQIFTRWSHFGNRATNAPFTVYSGLGGNSELGTTLVNQQLAPVGDFSNGVAWQSIGTFEVTSNTLRVRLANNANGYVVGDAIRIVGGGIGFQSGEIDVAGFGRSIATGDFSPAPEDATDFGAVPSLGVTFERTFTITNNGNADLVLTGNPFVAIGGPHTADFTVTEMPAPVIAPGGKSDFKIAFRATDVGFRSATVSIANTDDSEHPFEFVVQGYLAPAAAALAHNGTLPQDVNDDGRVNTSDALMIINHLLTGPAAAPLVAGISAEPLTAPSVFYDVVPDGRVNTSDLLSIFNRLLTQSAAAQPLAAQPVPAQPLVASVADEALVLFDLNEDSSNELVAVAHWPSTVETTNAVRPHTTAMPLVEEDDLELASDEEIDPAAELDFAFLED